MGGKERKWFRDDVTLFGSASSRCDRLIRVAYVIHTQDVERWLNILFLSDYKLPAILWEKYPTIAPWISSIQWTRFNRLAWTRIWAGQTSSQAVPHTSHSICFNLFWTHKYHRRVQSSQLACSSPAVLPYLSEAAGEKERDSLDNEFSILARGTDGL